ncbi:hypothetical protein HP570_06840 [Brevibacillus sp. RS1.1]|uniref:Uncharacterized protein n=1 Tax=Brevibacillus antibioticus TaxID=2570228 RepID=A0A4U2Y737_9BACL|nr:hypothetical protein [Brevibacillus formosus]NQF17226.1 hypothetical protein [Brevibacillus sp. HB1.3]NRR01933.1 hypothetical protein [Brevibacillus sp. RS1.1]NRS48400.1 hypothetical protein [Brevibacillus sp. HB2.2]OUQ85905.1 hypothetical protein B5G50_23800 [Brevibacillus brevis]PSK18075.1 hypothetical protein C7R94_12905 [Brevibacillus sp. NRRL NRS-603]TKI56450.1 hypothetical protein E8L90_13785 [Brevibacillus antibioticus]TQR39192.1 hypothetical protein C7Y45_03810 [Lysinibacillus sp.
MMNFRWKYNPTYLRIKYGCKQVLFPLLVFQFVRTVVFPTSFDVILLGLLAMLYVAISLEWL